MFKNKKILILGLARSGFQAAKVLIKRGNEVFLNDFKESMDYIKNVDLLLIDDLGAENLTAYNRDEILCPILQYRMDNHLTTFITSNFNINELNNHLSKSKDGIEEIKAGRIISRINQLTDDLEMISKNLRK